MLVDKLRLPLQIYYSALLTGEQISKKIHVMGKHCIVNTLLVWLLDKKDIIVRQQLKADWYKSNHKV